MMKIFQLKISKLFYADFLEELQQYILNSFPLRGASFSKGSHKHREKTCKLVFTPNPEICLKTLEDEEFLHVLQSADYLTSDGLGLYLAYQMNDFHYPKVLIFIFLPYFFINILFRKKYLYQKYGERICGSDLTSDLVHFAQKNKIRIAIVDPYFPDDEGKCTAQKHFREKLTEKFPNLEFDYYILGKESQENILKNIQKSEAKICFATLGMKKQELFCQQVQKYCPNIALALGVGSSFDYYTGFQKRAPKIFRELGFEWLYRIFTSPNTLNRLGRMYQAVIVFPIKVLLYKDKV